MKEIHDPSLCSLQFSPGQQTESGADKLSGISRTASEVQIDILLHRSNMTLLPNRTTPCVFRSVKLTNAVHDAPSWFLRFPGDIRNKIYTHLVSFDDDAYHDRILGVCKQIRKEACGILRSRRVFRIATKERSASDVEVTLAYGAQDPTDEGASDEKDFAADELFDDLDRWPATLGSCKRIDIDIAFSDNTDIDQWVRKVYHQLSILSTFTRQSTGALQVRVNANRYDDALRALNYFGRVDERTVSLCVQGRPHEFEDILSNL